jgi:ABC-type antimicrobial peptide transport system permease subunit
MDRLAPSIREVVARADAGLPVSDLRTQSAQIATHVSRERTFARLLLVFSGFALLIACIGLYGVTSFAVARRRSEMGVRLALGARPDQILWLVVRQVLVLAAGGLAVGLLLAYWLTPVIGSMLYGLEPTDATTLTLAGALMLLVAAAAGWLPALRAARTDALASLAAD